MTWRGPRAPRPTPFPPPRFSGGTAVAAALSGASPHALVNRPFPAPPRTLHTASHNPAPSLSSTLPPGFRFPTPLANRPVAGSPGRPRNPSTMSHFMSAARRAREARGPREGSIKYRACPDGTVAGVHSRQRRGRGRTAARVREPVNCQHSPRQGDAARPSQVPQGSGWAEGVPWIGGVSMQGFKWWPARVFKACQSIKPGRRVERHGQRGGNKEAEGLRICALGPGAPCHIRNACRGWWWWEESAASRRMSTASSIPAAQASGSTTPRCVSRLARRTVASWDTYSEKSLTCAAGGRGACGYAAASGSTTEPWPRRLSHGQAGQLCAPPPSDAITQAFGPSILPRPCQLPRPRPSACPSLNPPTHTNTQTHITRGALFGHSRAGPRGRAGCRSGHAPA